MLNRHEVSCIKLNKLAPGLDSQPFPGELGVYIFEHVSQEAWREWMDDVMIKIINENRLDLSTEDDYQTLVSYMKTYLNIGI